MRQLLSVLARSDNIFFATLFSIILVPIMILDLMLTLSKGAVRESHEKKIAYYQTTRFRILLYIIFAVSFLWICFTALWDNNFEKYKKLNKHTLNTEYIAQLEQQANQGDVVAQTMLGRKYYYGNGVHQNYREAYKWSNKAAEQDNAWAQFALGNMYFEGTGIPKDREKAFYWRKKAAEKGFNGAYLQVGSMYLERANTKEDFIEAFAWCNLVAISNSRDSTKRDARQCLTTAKENLMPEELEKAEERYKEYREKYAKPFQ